MPLADKVITNSIMNNHDKVLIAGDERFNAHRKHYTYAIHPRFKELRCHDVAARLQLAAMYTASDSLYPDRRMGMTGSQFAMDLVRRSYVDRPLTPVESIQLSN